MSSWIKLFRDINKHWIWQNSDYLKWWLDILLEVNYAPSKVVINNKIYDCNRGEKLYSLDTWAVRWGTNKSKARRFLNLLQNDNMIVLKSETQTTRLTVCKYDTYQDMRNANETQMKRKRNADETHLTPIEEGKELKKDNIIKLHSSEFHSEGKLVLFSDIEDVNEFISGKGFNHCYFYLAYRFWELWKSEFINHKHLKNTKAKEWYDSIRLIIETDKQSIDRIIAIYIYFTKCQQKEKGFEDMLFSEVKSLPALRKETRSGVYRIDQIIDKVNSKLQSNKDFNIEVSNAITKFKNKFKCEK